LGGTGRAGGQFDRVEESQKESALPNAPDRVYRGARGNPDSLR